MRGGATIKPRCPLPSGVRRSITRPEKLSLAVSSFTRSSRIKRREIVEENLVSCFLRWLEVDRIDFDQREIAFAFFRRSDLARNGVSGTKIEAANLRGRNIDVVRTRQIVVLRRAQEAETIR